MQLDKHRNDQFGEIKSINPIEHRSSSRPFLSRWMPFGQAPHVTWILLVFVFTLSLGVFGETRKSELPEVEIAKSTKSSANEAVKAIYTAAPAEHTSPQFDRLFFREDLSAVEVEAMQKLIADESIPHKEKEITLVRYTLGDPRVTQVLIEAKKKGIAVKLITDLNPVMTLDFSQKESDSSAAFSKAKLKDTEKSPGAKLISELLDAGFAIKKDIFSQPLYNSELERSPIMHEKALLLKAGGKKTIIFGTANLAPNPRYNRIYEVEDDAFYDRYQSHVDALVDIYSKGKETKEIPEQPRTLIQYPDGTEMELAFTDGRYNPNDRISALLEQNKVNNITLSHFVITHRGFLKALGKSFKANPNASGFAVADDRFSSLNKGWGLAPALAGIDITDPFNRRVTGLTPENFRRIESYVYQRPAIDPETGKMRKETSEDGPPVARHVWHDKTTLIDYEDKSGKVQSSIFTGSFNLSNNIANSEFQVQFNLPKDSWIRNAVEHSIRSVVSKEPQWAVPTLEASLRNAMGVVFGLTDLEIPLEKIRKLMESIDKRNFDGIKSSLKEIASTETNLRWKTSHDVKQERLNQFLDFLSWYQENMPPSNLELELRMRRIVGIALVIGQPNMKEHIKANIMSSVIERPQLSIEQHHKLLDEAFKRLGLSDINPWSGATSKLISIEEILSPDFLKELSKQSGQSLPEVIEKKIQSGDFNWKGTAFDQFIDGMKSEKQSSLMTVFHAGTPSAEEISRFMEVLRKQGKKMGLPTDLQKLPPSHVFDTKDPEELEKRLTRLFQNQAKKGIVSSEVISSDPTVNKTVKLIKSEKLKSLSDLKISVSETPAAENCAEVFSHLL